MDSARPESGESARLLPQSTPHRIPVDPSLNLDDPNGKRLWTFSLPTLFRPWIMGWALTSIIIMSKDFGRSGRGLVYIIFTWVLFFWTLLAIVASYFTSGNRSRKGWKIDFGVFMCVFFGSHDAYADDDTDGDDGGKPKNRRHWGQPLVDLAWAIIFFVFPGAIMGTGSFQWITRDFIIITEVILAISQLLIALIGFIPALRRFKFHLYKEDAESERYRIQLPRETRARNQAASVSA